MMIAITENLSRTVVDTLSKKGQQMKHMEERFLENCRAYDYHKPVTPLFIAVALGRQDAERDKVAVIWTGNLMRSQRLQTLVGKSGPQTRSQTSTPPRRGA